VIYEATCCCKQISITVSGIPEINGICHCDNCKKRTGSAFGMSTYFDVNSVENKTGKTSVYKFYHNELKHEQNRYFCKNCGTTLYWTVSTIPHLIGISGGCFINSLPEPSTSVTHSNKFSWVALPNNWDVQE